MKFFIILAVALLSVVFAEKLSTGEDSETFVQEHIAGSDVMVFAKSYCPHSHRARALLEILNEKSSFTMEIMDIDLLEDGPIIQMELLKLTGQRTVPNIFIGGHHVGGNSDLQELHSDGKVSPMISAAMMARRTANEYL